MSTMPLLCCFGASHKTASVDFREMMYLPPLQLQAVMKKVMDKHGVKELVVLSTCNRFEMYALLPAAVESGPEALLRAWSDLQIFSGKTPPIDDQIRKNTFYLEGQVAAEHIFSVAASLDSLVVGETQITGQFKNAMLMAADVGSLGPFLDRLCQEVLSVAKKIRTRTKIGEKKVSISHAAIDLAGRVFRKLSDHAFLIIGAGEMAEVAARYVCSYNPRQIFVVNRTSSRAAALVRNLGSGRAYDWNNLNTCLIRSDIVISSTGSLRPILSVKELKNIMKERRGRALFLVDIAIPRDIEPGCGNLDDVYLFGIDDLEKVVEGNLDERRQAAEQARIFVEKGARLYMRWLASASLKPVLASFRDYLEELMDRELAKTTGRSLFEDLSSQQKQALKGMQRSVAGKILGDAARAVSKPDEEAFREQLAAAIRIMFTCNPDPSDRKQNHDRDNISWENRIIRL